MDETICFARLDRSFIVPLSDSIPFDLETWQKVPELRALMLFDLNHRGLCRLSRDAVHSMLGLPDREREKPPTEDYSLGKIESFDTYLSLSFLGDSVQCFRLEQYCEEGFPKVNPDWQRNNRTVATVAHEFNHHYCIVGANLQILFPLWGMPQKPFPYTGNLYKCGPLELESNESTKIVTRFRHTQFAPDEWQTEDQRPEPRCFTTTNSYSHASKFRGAHWLNLEDPFDQLIWRERDHRRSLMLTHFVRTHPLIGMSRENVQTLLGKPDATDYNWHRPQDLREMIKNEIQPCDSEFHTESYFTTFPSCGNMASGLFELMYSNDTVESYRRNSWGGGFGGRRQMRHGVLQSS